MAKNGPNWTVDELGAPTFHAEAMVDGAQPTGIRYIYVGVAGNLVWTDYFNNTMTWPLQVGYHPIIPKSVNLPASTVTAWVCY